MHSSVRGLDLYARETWLINLQYSVLPVLFQPLIRHSSVIWDPGMDLAQIPCVHRHTGPSDLPSWWSNLF